MISIKCIDPCVLEFMVSIKCIDLWVLEFMISIKCIDPWVLEFMISIKYIDPWVLEFMISNTISNSQWENCISLDFNFRIFSEPRKLEPHD